MNWRNLALAMTAACGGLLMPSIGGLLLLLAALLLGLLTHKWVG